ncbi:MAG: flagellin FliC [Candidatus Hydrogenedentes bacterium CG07_land_8_20_14_0_80_42_17]|nr:MAG: flagellin FliC [Candidatus Hydrogenedentes bacterium CG07_land_8_20_14_0_80_42_17]
MSGLRIKTNVSALFASRLLTQTSGALNKSIERLSSGLRINRAADDAAGFGVSERMRTQVNGLEQSKRNAQDAISLIQVAEGGLSQISDMLQRLRTLAVQASNDTNTTVDRRVIQTEVNQLIAEIGRQASATSFNGRILLNGTFASGTGSLVFQVGANQGERLAVNIASISITGLALGNLQTGDTAGLTSGGVITQAGAESAITLIQSAVDTVSRQRGDLGAYVNRFENVVAFVGISTENITAAESRIRDADFAEEIVNFTKNQILQQTGISALSQANISPQVVLSLLQ